MAKLKQTHVYFTDHERDLLAVEIAHQRANSGIKTQSGLIKAIVLAELARRRRERASRLEAANVGN